MNYENSLKEATYFLSHQIKFPLNSIDKNYINEIKEIRLKINSPVCLVTHNRRLFLRYDGSLSADADVSDLCIVSENDMEESVSRITGKPIRFARYSMKPNSN